TEVRLIDEGEARIISRAEAEALAQEKGLDLIVVSLDSSPPVVKLVDYGKFRFEQEKKEREAKKKQHAAALKEVKMGVRIGEHDYLVKMEHAKAFLKDGHKVKMTVRMKGREIQHPELARNIGIKFVKDLETVGTPEMGPRLEGRQLLVVMAPSGGSEKPKASSPAKATEVKAPATKPSATNTSAATTSSLEAPSAQA
ncbi:MAG: translation initiation factor IF-3, partial [Vampirovibrionales bacterium]|nr:translation initiation factor IF-3 [Vampirovibrionales bacterium]